MYDDCPICRRCQMRIFHRGGEMTTITRDEATSGWLFSGPDLASGIDEPGRLRGSRSPAVALDGATGTIASRVLLWGELHACGQRVCASVREVVWSADATAILRDWAIWCLRNTPLHDGRTVWHLLTDRRSWEAVEAAERYVRGEASAVELEDARTAARDVWLHRVADDPHESAALAAWQVASPDARSAALGSGTSTRRAAAGYAALDKGPLDPWTKQTDALWDATWAAALAAQDAELTRRLLALWEGR